MNSLVDGCVDDVPTAHDVGLDGLKRVVFTSWYLLEGSGMDDNCHSVQGPLKPSRIAHIPDEIAETAVIQARTAHVVLFEFITTEDHQLFGAVLAQHDLDKFLAK